MKPNFVIRRQHLPVTLPFYQTATIYLLLDHFHSGQLIYGIVGTLLAIGWITLLVARWNQKPADLKVIMGKETTLKAE